jgi:aspartate aminotransferase
VRRFFTIVRALDLDGLYLLQEHLTVTQSPISVSLESPVFSVPSHALVPVSGYLSTQVDIPQSRMFIIKKLLATFREKHPDLPAYDASQGDGGASLPGVPHNLLERAFALLKQNGTAYDPPIGTLAFRKATAEQYWQFKAEIGYSAENIAATDGGRDALIKVYQAMLTLGTGRIGDVLLVSRVPWISYLWGPYGVGMNVLLAPGAEADGWEYTEDGLAESVAYCAKYGGGRRVAGLVITSPDNPTGRTLSMERQIALAQKAFALGIPFVLFDWIYHQITEGAPADINVLLSAFTPEERARIIVLDGLTKSLGASNIRAAHVVAAKPVIEFIASRSSHGVMPNFFGQAVAQAAYEIGFRQAAASIIEPTNASRAIVRAFVKEKGYRAVIGDGGYYAFIDCTEAIRRGNLADSVALVEYMAENFGLTAIAGSYFSEAGKNWIRFSYALPPEITAKALERFDEAMRSL